MSWFDRTALRLALVVSITIAVWQAYDAYLHDLTLEKQLRASVIDEYRSTSVPNCDGRQRAAAEIAGNIQISPSGLSVFLYNRNEFDDLAFRLDCVPEFIEHRLDRLSEADKLFANTNWQRRLEAVLAGCFSGAALSFLIMLSMVGVVRIIRWVFIH
jgi:ABC-type Fe3+-siderophore transport system permease subunit